MTAHILGSAYLRQERYGMALAAAGEASELAPASHVACLNAGKAAYHDDQFEVAQSYLKRGLKIVPGYVSLQQVLAKVEAGGGDAAVARMLVEVAGFRDSTKGRVERSTLGAQVEIDLAIRWQKSAPDRCESAIQRALAHCDMLPVDSITNRRVRLYARAIRSNDSDAYIDALLLDLQLKPLSANRLSLLADIPLELWSAKHLSATHSWVAQLHRHVQRVNALAGSIDPLFHRR